MGEKLQLVRKGREGRTVLGARGSALLALALTYIACTHPYYTKTQKTAWFAKCMVPPWLIHTEDINGGWQGASAHHRHHALPLLCIFLRTAVSEADQWTANHVRVYACLNIKHDKRECKSYLRWTLLSCSLTRVYTCIVTPVIARRRCLQRQSTHAAHHKTYVVQADV